MTTRRQIAVSLILLLAAGAVVGLYVAWAAPADRSGGTAGHDHSAMSGGGDEPLDPVRLTDRSARAIGVTFARVERRPLDRSVRAVGTVEYDETRLAALNPKIDGWVERLYVDFTGAPVRRGQAMLEVYSPMLVTAQEELVLARRLADAATGDRAAGNARTLLESARRRLAYWDISEDEIARIEASGRTRKTLTLRAPATGIVVAKNVVEGGRIAAGSDAFEIADLATVWVEGEVFETDLSLVSPGQEAEVTFQAYPGEVFDGVVAFVYPSVSLDSRTARIRVELENRDLRLRPGMYATVRLRVAQDEPRLSVPRGAVLSTGERAVVFVRHADGLLVPHEVTTGLRTADRIEILAGVEEGREVVASASFLIDAESNLGAALDAMEGRSGTDGIRPLDGAETVDRPVGGGRAPGWDEHAGHSGAGHSGASGHGAGGAGGHQGHTGHE